VPTLEVHEPNHKTRKSRYANAAIILRTVWTPIEDGATTLSGAGVP
jgi:hypothetical protein